MNVCEKICLTFVLRQSPRALFTRKRRHIDIQTGKKYESFQSKRYTIVESSANFDRNVVFFSTDAHVIEIHILVPKTSFTQLTFEEIRYNRCR